MLSARLHAIRKVARRAMGCIWDCFVQTEGEKVVLHAEFVYWLDESFRTYVNL